MNFTVPLFDILSLFSYLVDFISPKVATHHLDVAYISQAFGKEMGLTNEELSDLFIAAILHDIGALTLKERIEALEFEFNEQNRHAEKGYRLLRMYPPFEKAAEIVRFHHTYWDNGEGAMKDGLPVHRFSHLIHLADRISIVISKENEILSQKSDITDFISKMKGKMFHPDMVKIFLSVAKRDAFWFDAANPYKRSIITKNLVSPHLYMEDYSITDLSRFFSALIDFRSRFTATHSAGVAAVAENIAALMGYNSDETKNIKLSGHLHDLGKLVVPSEIIEKPTTLHNYERNIIKSHTYYTYRILEQIPAFYDIKRWAGYHHERLSGNGYPFKIRNIDIPVQSRIIAIADIFTAMLEERPYRKGLEYEKLIFELTTLQRGGEIDGDITDLVISRFDDINRARMEAQNQSIYRYSSFIQDKETC